MSGRYAFVTLVTSDHYLPGALAVAAGLKEVHPLPPVEPEVSFQTACIVTPETVDVKTIKHLRRAFDVVIGVEVIEQQNTAGLQLLGRPDLYTVLTKLHVFRLTQFEKIIFLDADTLPIRPLSHLFTLPYEFSAVPDVGWPDIFNSGMMVLTPGEDKFDEVMNVMRSRGSWDGGDQGVLNEWRGSNWHRLSFTYNTTPTAAYTYAPAYERFGSQISAIHFIGPNKPWNELPYRAPGSASQISQQKSSPLSDNTSIAVLNTVPSQSYAYASLVDRWFGVYDRNYRQNSFEFDEDFEIRRYENVWDEPISDFQAQRNDSPVAGHVLGLEELRKLALEGGSAITRQDGEGEYRSLPLEGRIDLMRPKRDAPPEVKAEVETLHGLSVGPLEQQRPSTPSRLPTPNPSEIPPSPQLTPRPLPQSLPPTPGPSQPTEIWDRTAQGPTQQWHPPPPDHETPAPVSESQGQQQLWQQERQQEYHASQEHISSIPPTVVTATPVSVLVHAEPARPSSPPLITWNPAIEPPPNVAPTPSAFPADAYFPNVWDIPTSAGRFHAAATGDHHQDSSAFFQPPPPSQIPQQLIQEGHYTNVMGPLSSSASQESHTQPDISKVLNVFPWEEKPRHIPGRVFPDSDSAPLPGIQYIEEMLPEPKSEPSLPAPPPLEPKAVERVSSPNSLRESTMGYPGARGFSNAWDSVPSIQRYAARLVKPPPGPAPPVSVSPRGPRRRSDSYRSRGEQSDANSMDGDVEDEVDDDEAEAAGMFSGSEKSDDGRRKREKGVVKSPPSGSKTPPSGSARLKSSKYRSIGVQTVPKDVRSVAVQVSQPVSSFPTGRSDEHHRRSGSRPHSKQGSGTSSPASVVQETKTGPEQIASTSLNIANAQSSIRPLGRHQQSVPSGMISPRLHDAYTYESPSRSPPTMTPGTHSPLAPTKLAQQAGRLPALTAQHMAPSISIARTLSTETAESSIGPLSPADSPVVLSTRKLPSRIWDPSTGVDVFKRGSEEVLARFLRMGSWDDDQQASGHTHAAHASAR